MPACAIAFAPGRSVNMPPALHRLEEMFPDDLRTRLEERPILVLPIGTIEWHSHHLPLGLDGLVAQQLCEQIARACGAVLAPATYWAVGGVPYPYTLNLPIRVVQPLLESVFEQFGAMGFRLIVAFTGHFGLEHTLALKEAAVAVMQRSPATILPVTEYDLVTDQYAGDHAGIGETSLLLALRQDLVRLNAVPASAALDGIIGVDPRGAATPARGQELAGAITTRTSAVAQRLLTATSPVQRSDYIAALAAAVAVLARTSEQRRVLPKSLAPPLATPAYLDHCEALFRGDYRAARQHAERKLANLAE